MEKIRDFPQFLSKFNDGYHLKIIINYSYFGLKVLNFVRD